MTNRFEFLTTPITTHEHTTEKKWTCMYML